MSAHDPESHLPPHHNPLPELGEPAPGGYRITTAEEFVAAQSSAEFAELRRKFRTFAFPWTVAFLVWYFAYVLLSTYAEEFMSTPVIGHINVGLLMGLAQFATTFLLTWLYVRHANRNLDPLASKMRSELEGDA
jgi:uncharacterized membrane protein (DUF485 family)